MDNQTLIESLSAHIITNVPNDDHFTIISGIIGNLAAYLADALEG